MFERERFYVTFLQCLVIRLGTLAILTHPDKALHLEINNPVGLLFDISSTLYLDHHPTDSVGFVKNTNSMSKLCPN